MVPFKLGYSLHEAGSHFARNLSTSLGAVVTIFLSLFIIGLFAILSSMISNVVGDVESRITIQADAANRMSTNDVLRMTVPNNKGELVSLSSLVRAEWITGPMQVTRYNGYPAMKITGAIPTRTEATKPVRRERTFF